MVRAQKVSVDLQSRKWLHAHACWPIAMNLDMNVSYGQIYHQSRTGFSLYPLFQHVGC